MTPSTDISIVPFKKSNGGMLIYIVIHDRSLDLRMKKNSPIKIPLNLLDPVVGEALHVCLCKAEIRIAYESDSQILVDKISELRGRDAEMISWLERGALKGDDDLPKYFKSAPEVDRSRMN